MQRSTLNQATCQRLQTAILSHKRLQVVQPRHLDLVKVSAAKNASIEDASSSSYPFFNRATELKYLADHCSTPPTSVTVIIGPRSAGKTALLQKYMHQRGLTNSRCFIDARSTAITTPSALARALMRFAVPKIVQQLFPDAQGLRSVVETLSTAISDLQDKVKLDSGSEFSFSGKALAPILKALSKDSGEVPPLALVTEGYIALLDAWHGARAAGRLPDADPPVLVLDEVNVLMSWGEQYKLERQTLLNFFVAITKVQQRSHVLLATSNYSFQAWLSREIGPTFFDTFVVGDFPAHEARGFLDQCLSLLGEPEAREEEWEDVYKVCGGNAGSLQRAATFRHTLHSWKAALNQVAHHVWTVMEPGHTPAPDAGYTARDYAAAVKAILESPYHTVDKQQLTAMLGTSVDAMVQANQLALRPYSPWATDIDVKAFGGDCSARVVTAPTHLHLYQMQRKRGIILAPLDTQQEQTPEGNGLATSSSRSSSPTSDAIKAVALEITAVRDRIDELQGQIQGIADKITSIMSTQRGEWHIELGYWQTEKQQLVEERRQLMEEKRLLLEEKLLLLKREE